MLCYLGIQDACRKRTSPSKEPGELEGTSIDASKGLVTVFVSVKKWIKTNEIILHISLELEEEGDLLDFKQLEKDCGYLVYISRTYRSMVPYLKVTHQTLDSWRSGRNKDGWKLFLEELREFYSPEDFEIPGDGGTPSKVKAVTRLKSDVAALTILLAGEDPYRVPVRVRKNGWVGYVMGDASGDSFGAAFYIEGVLLFRYGQYASSISEASSNCRELRNLV